ncbi:MAG: L-histidine N(alpha)-methyltransferase, partial [Woeseiaceae bacterium]|nr:L-histidine N(alpha)-methyltransferase [Woeseiaceae bacterium]
LAHFEDVAVYVPVDISEEHLLESQMSIKADFPGVEVLPVVADFTRPFALPNPEVAPLRNIVYFPGSTIGNFEYEDALGLLRVMHQEAGEDGALLIGIDLQKAPAVINAAYNDAAGVTARFNLNILSHLNHAFGADFDVDAFEHRANYDEEEGRVAIELVSDRDQVVSIGGEVIDIASGEAILTEYSHKYTLDGFAAMANDAGFVMGKAWTDPERRFGVLYCTRD